MRPRHDGIIDPMFRLIWATVSVIVILLSSGPAYCQKVVEVFEIYYGQAGDMAGAVKLVLSPEGKMSVDESSNIIIVNDRPVNVEEARKLIKRLDRAPKNIRIEVEFFEEERINSLGLNLQWRVEGAGFAVATIPAPGSPGAQVDVHQLLKNARSTKKQFLRVMENQTGRIFVGESVPFAGYLVRYGYIEKDVTFKNAGTSFVARAKTITGGKIALSLEPEVSSYDGGNNSFTVKNAATMIVLDDPGSVALGGVDSVEESFGGSFLQSAGGREANSRFVMVITVQSEK